MLVIAGIEATIRIEQRGLTGDHARVVNDSGNSRHQSRRNGDDEETVDQFEGEVAAEKVQLQVAINEVKSVSAIRR